MRQIQTYLNLSIDRNPEDLELLGLTTLDLAEANEARSVRESLRQAGSDNEAAQNVFSKVVLPFWERYSDHIDKVIYALRLVWANRRKALMAPDLKPAIDREVLTVQGWVEDLPPHERMFLADEEFLTESFAGMIERLQDPARVAMLDPALAPPPEPAGSVRPDAPAALASAVISRLPGLDDLPLIEVLDLREELSEYLPYFRSEMIRLSEDLTDAQSHKDVAAEIDRRWHRDLAPAMEEIRREVAAARYPRRLLDAVTSDPATMASGAGALVIATGGLAVGLSALIPALAAAAYPFLKAKTLRDLQLQNAQTNKLFFLYALQNRITR
ncbi:hypothetical protein ACI2K4_22390 [Micromonospora sp. NPDC050397]|uniref:hypothetical protein n=1 Tax=Micromonospora sp. NPDC050397 TaxID=3364279 RepID=UPI0038509FC2